MQYSAKRDLTDPYLSSQDSGNPARDLHSDPRSHLFMRRARQIVFERKMFRQRLGAPIFKEAACDVLLFLYAEVPESRYTITQLTNLVGAPATTVLRWIDALEKRGLIVRQSHPTDCRKVFVKLSGTGRARLDSCFSEIPSSA